MGVDSYIAAPRPRVGDFELRTCGDERVLEARPLSLAQQSLTLIDPPRAGFGTGLESDEFHVSVRFSGPLDLEILEQALSALVGRHRILRSRFYLRREQWVQQVQEEMPWVLPVVDLSSVTSPKNLRPPESASFDLPGSRSPGLDPVSGSVLLGRVLRWGRHHHELQLSLHRIVCDLESIRVLMAELATFYNALGGAVLPGAVSDAGSGVVSGALFGGSRGKATAPLQELPELPELPVQYGDFAEWQQGWLPGPVLEEQTSYWHRRLGDSLEPLELPLDRPRPARRGRRLRRRSRRLPVPLPRKLQSLASSERGSFFIHLLASFQMLLSRWTGQSRIVVACSITHRQSEDTQRSIGPFANTLPLLADLSGDPRIEAVLRQVEKEITAALQHPDVPFRQLSRQLDPASGSHRPALAQVSLEVDRRTGGPVEFSGVEAHPVELPSDLAEIDLSLAVSDYQGEIAVALRYDATLFDPTTVGRLGRSWGILLAAMMEDAEQRLGDLPVLDTAQRQQLVTQWNDTASCYPEESPLHELFEAQAKQTPEGLAVVSGQESLTYRELDIRANRVATALRHQGVGTESLVGLCVERSAEMIAAILGILKAGGAYLPLDPEYPAERLRFMMQDGELKALLVGKGLRPALPMSEAPVVELVEVLEDSRAGAPTAPAAGKEPARGGETPFAPSAGANRLAYVMYTSGSTGQPKGVAVTHRSIARLVLHTNYLDLGPSDRVAQLATASFDAITFEVWGALLNGGAVVIVPRQVALDPLRFSQHLEAHRVTAMFLTVTLFNQVAQVAPEAFSRMRYLLFGGETADPRWVRRARQVPGLEVLANGYGPTESTTFAVSHPVQEVPEGAARVPIGRPISNTTSYVVDRRGSLTPLGVTGELVLGGAGLARGYLGRPALTAERFVPDPFSSLPGQRLYRTSDLVRMTGDGTIDCLGRVDRQVKLRGFRIELGEIETVLRGHEAVKEALVLVRPTETGDRQLVAYWIEENEWPGEARESVKAADLRSWLTHRMPEYMAPAAFVRLESWPLNSSGKTDHSALPSPREALDQDPDFFVAPRSSSEKTLARLWSEALGLQKIGVHDNFFELGGHSLVAMQVISRLREDFSTEISLAALFEAPTVAGLAAWLDSEEANAPESADRVTLPLKASGDLEWPLSSYQQSLWLEEQRAPGTSSYNVALAATFHGALDETALRWSLNRLVARHQVLRGRFELRDGEAVQVVASSGKVLPQVSPEGFSGDFPLRTVDLRTSANEGTQEVRERLDEEIYRPFDLAEGPLCRGVLVQQTEQLWHLALVLHHIVSDGWSLKILVEEVEADYERYRRAGDTGPSDTAAGNPTPSSQIPEDTPLPLQYGDFSRWQRQRLEEEIAPAHMEFWRSRWEDPPPPLDLPTDRPRPRQRSRRGDLCRIAVSPDLESRLRSRGQRRGLTLFSLLLSSFALVLQRLSGRLDIPIGAPVMCRSRPELEGLIGYFVNTLVLTLSPRRSPTVQTFLAAAQAEWLEADAHKEVPFADLVSLLTPRRELSQSPLFQTMFAFDSGLVRPPRFPGVRSELLEVDSRSANFDLTLVASESQQGLALSLEYDLDLFDTSTAERMLQRVAVALEAVSAEEDSPISSLRLLAPGEEAQLIQEWSGEGALVPSGEPLSIDVQQGSGLQKGSGLQEGHGLQQGFQAQVQRNPSAIALEDAQGTLTYGELDRRSRSLAAHLVELGVGPDQPVGLLLEPGRNACVAVLAILEAGGAYLPLSPSFTDRRLLEICQQAFQGPSEGPTVSVMVMEESSRGRLSLPGLCEVVATADSTSPSWKGAEASQGPALLSEHQTAYVLFTSGSTGRPKGVPVSHGAASAYLHSAVQRFQLSAEDRFLNFTSLSFDPSLLEIFATWQAGGTVVLPDPAMMGSTARFLDYCHRHRITQLNLPTAFWHQVVSGLEAGQRLPPNLRQVVIGGEAALQGKVAGWWQQVSPQVSFFNAYGPTEAVVEATVADLSSPRPDGHIPIGTPTTDNSAYVLDREGRLAIAEEVGEIHLGGSLARGYLHQPALTAASFVPHPWSNRPGERLYRSGDLGRWQGSGELLCLGRRDQQIKVRGFRVEPGEIEAALESHPAVAQAVVVPHQAPGEGSGAMRLAAYWTPSQGSGEGVAVSESLLRSFLQMTLPEYMVPDSFTPMVHLPMSASGKVDRLRLPDPPERAPSGDSIAASLTPLEESLAALWREVLGCGPVQSQDDFFALGGDSLRGMNLLSRVQRVFAADLGLAQLFEHSTLGGLALLLESSWDLHSPPPLVPAGEEDSRQQPLSFAQERLWFLEQLEPETAAYNVPLLLRLEGDLSVPRLEESLRSILRRHQVLASRIGQHQEQHQEQQQGQHQNKRFQEILPPAQLRHWSCPLVEASGLDQEAVEELVAKEIWQPFDLAQGPLMRALLLRRGQRHHLLVLTFHHIAFDGESVGPLLADLSAFYGVASSTSLCSTAASEESSSPGELTALSELAGDLPAEPQPLAIQYADFARWQRQWLTGEALEKPLEHWRGHLKGAPGLLELPTDRPRSKRPNPRGQEVDLALTPEVGAGLQQLAREGGVTLFMVLLASYQHLLWRFSGQRDVVIGFPVSHRRQPQLKPLLGAFINTLSLRTQVEPAESFVDLLARVREVMVAGLRFQDLPFELLVQDLQPGRDLDHTPLFQVSLLLEQPLPGAISLGPVRGIPQDVADPRSKFDLTLRISHQGEALEGALRYRKDLFDRTTISRLAARLQATWRGILENPAQPLANLPAMPRSERHQLVTEWGSWESPQDGSSWQSFPARVAAWARRCPEALAVKCEGEAWSYSQLHQQARRLALRLRSAGVRTETPVALHLERSVDAVVALLAVLQAGGSFLPLDPEAPAQRKVDLLRRAGVRLWIGELDEELEKGAPELLRLSPRDRAGRPSPKPSMEDGPSFENPVAPNQLAYSMFTSGSTGRPKGVMITHGQLAAYLDGVATRLVLPLGSSYATVSSLAADLGYTTLLGGLSNGGCVHVLAKHRLMDAEAMADYFRSEPVDCLKIVPSHLEALLISSRGREILPRRVLALGGEAARPSLLEQVRSAAPQCRILNHYGPTEATVGVAAFDAGADPASGPMSPAVEAAPSSRNLSALPLGRPLGGARLYVLDSYGEAVGAGVAGELWIGGATVARGYLGDSRQTAEKFLPDSYGPAPGERLYRTGDLGRWNRRGQLEFLGRVDDQLKIRGFRVEPAEIELALTRHPQVRGAVVVTQRDPAGEARLAAYVEPTPGTAPSMEELVAHASGLLPSALIPSSVTLLDRIPLTSNGKVDRRSLPAPQFQQQDRLTPFRPPSSATEISLVEIWTGILGTETIGVDDDFFALGGHSLRATQVISRIRDVLGVQLPLRDLFEAPTVAKLASRVAQAPRKGLMAQPAGLVKASRDRFRRPRAVGSSAGGEGR
ncbi:MAG: amino acid adenylation domain-containing protein [Deltaproteobacteria bacterium]|nr:amino acid adenylation domain-containing protein [Deltaproteobacteria bacterium]